MTCSRVPRISAALAALAPLILAFGPPPAGAQGRWTYSIAAGHADRFVYRVEDFSFGSYPSSFRSGFQASSAATRTITKHVSVHLEAGYAGYSRALGLRGIGSPPMGRLRAGFFPVAAGLQLGPFTNPHLAVRPYLQIAPALVLSRWEERVTYAEGWDLTTGAWRPRSAHVDARWNALPGFVAAMGCRGQLSSVVGIEGALRYTRSADGGYHTLGQFSSGEFRGLSVWSAVAGLTWSP